MKNVGVIFGSRSAEHDVSVVTAISSVIKPLKLSNEYNPLAIYISKDGSWYVEPELARIDFFTSGDVEQKLNKFKKVQLLFDDGFWLVKPGLAPKKIKLDIVFPALHGTYGEDGSMMGLLRMAGVPFVGADMSASAIAMDKVFSKEIAISAGCNSPKYVWFDKQEFDSSRKAVINKIEKLKYPLFVKPAHLGSSIGLTKVSKPTDLEIALEVAFHYDDKVLVEEAVKNLIEVTLPIMGNEELTPALLEQPLLNDDGVFDFDTKYMNGGKKGGKGAIKGGIKGGAKGSKQGSQGYSIVPAKLSKELYEKAEAVALKAYKAIGAEGYSRVDLLIDSKSKKVYFNEINPMPGSLYAHNWRKAGVSNLDLVTKLLKLAEERSRRQAMLNTVFDTNFLSQF